MVHHIEFVESRFNYQGDEATVWHVQEHRLQRRGVVSNFEEPRGYGVQVRVDGLGGVGGMLGMPSARARWRGWGCCSGFLSKQWFALHVGMD